MSAVEGNRCEISVDARAEVNTKNISKAVKRDRNSTVRPAERNTADLAVVRFNQNADQAQTSEKPMLEDTSREQRNALQITNTQDQPSKTKALSSSPHQDHSSAAKAQLKPAAPPVRNTEAMIIASLITIV